MSNIRLYISNKYRLIYNILVRFNKYLLFRSKYLYLGTCKVLKLPKISTEQVLEELSNIKIYDGKGAISDELFEEQLDLAANVAQVGDKIIDLRHLPKGYMIIEKGEVSETS